MQKFEWDDNKAASNLRKHDITFDEAIAVFADPFAMTTQDRIEGGERRWQTLGMIRNCLIALVAHTIKDDAGVEIVRIISARAADKKERKRYENQYR